MRAGTYIKQASGYRAFIPKALPPDPALAMDAEMVRLLGGWKRAAPLGNFRFNRWAVRR